MWSSSFRYDGSSSSNTLCQLDGQLASQLLNYIILGTPWLAFTARRPRCTFEEVDEEDRPIGQPVSQPARHTLPYNLRFGIFLEPSPTWEPEAIKGVV